MKNNDAIRTYGIVGMGVVGSSVAAGFYKNNTADYWTYDTKNPSVGMPSDLKNTTAIFVCVNTPAARNAYQDANLSGALHYLNSRKYKGLVILLSTISYCQYNEMLLDLGGVSFTLMVSPEFLTAKYANNDFYYSHKVLYGPWINKSTDNKFKQAMMDCKDNPIRFDRRSISECFAIKTGRNLALFMKLLTANIIYNEAREHGMDKETCQSVVAMVFDDPRLATEIRYNKVGNHEHTMGIAGECLPKDVQAKGYSQDTHLVNEVIMKLVELNRHFRTIKL